MKRIFYVIVVVSLMLLVAGCGKKSVVGKWEYTTGGFLYTFNEDGTGSYGIPGSEAKFNYTVDGKYIAITYVGESDTLKVQYNVDKDKLTIIDSSNTKYVYNKK